MVPRVTLIPISQAANYPMDSPAYNDCKRILLNYGDQQSVLHICQDTIDEMTKIGYNTPMLWMGICVAVASLFCILLMVADLFHGFRNRKLWFPSKYFSFNTASIALILLAMQLPLDLNSAMPGNVDKLAKVGSMSFMTTMIANSMPSLASLGNMEVFTNVAGMTVLVVTMVDNVIIQMETGIAEKNFFHYVNIGAMLYLLVLVISSAITIPTPKKILELKYQVVHKRTSHLEITRMFRVEELIQHVRKYWVMAATCSPQLVLITTPLCAAAGVICVSTTIFHYLFMLYTFSAGDISRSSEYKSNYKWSVVVIYIIQSIGITVGTIAPVFRCFAAFSFELSIEWIKKQTKVCDLESYWTQTLLEWKEIHFAFPSCGGRISKALVHDFKNLILHLCIICQKLIVVSCKMIRLIPLGTVIIGLFCVDCWKSLKTNFFPREIIHADVKQNDTNHDMVNYVLQLQNEIELGTITLNSISNSINLWIREAEKQLPRNLLKLIEQCTGFEGVMNFDSDNIHTPMISVDFPNSWSLPVATLTCIAVTLPNISKESVDSLFNSVYEGLSYTFLVEESLNNVGEFKKIHMATMALWREVDVNDKWLGNTLQRNPHKEKSSQEILEWFAHKAEEIAVEMSKHNNEEWMDNRLIAADSMYRVTQAIMMNYPNHIQRNREEELFGLLSGMIADIMVACFTNLPRVIVMKCHHSVIEEREASVEAAARLVGSTMKIIEKLHAC